MFIWISHSPVEVRESVAANVHTSTDTLETLLQDKDVQIREAAVSNQNSPLSKIYELLHDDHEDVRGSGTQASIRITNKADLLCMQRILR
ncbi:hypothetical protein [Ruminococcus champanellensis]